MKWNIFGWAGILSLCLFVGFVTFPNMIERVPYRVASSLLLLAMLSSIACPIVAATRSSRWWLLVTLGGVLTGLRFFWNLSA